MYTNIDVGTLKDNLFYSTLLEEMQSDSDVLIKDLDYDMKEFLYESFQSSSFFYESKVNKKPKNDAKPTENNIFAKIGKVVEGIIKKMHEMLQRFTNIFNNFGFKNKTELEKLNTIVKSNPGIKDEIIEEFRRGNIDLKDVKSLNEFSDNYCSIIRKLDKGDIDPSTARSLWAKCEHKLADIGTSPVVKGIITAGSVVSAVGGIMKLISEGTKVATYRETSTKKEAEVLRQISKNAGWYGTKTQTGKIKQPNVYKQANNGFVDTYLFITNKKNEYLGKQYSMYGKVIRKLNSIVHKYTVDRLKNPKPQAGVTGTLRNKVTTAGQKRAKDYILKTVNRSYRGLKPEEIDDLPTKSTTP